MRQLFDIIHGEGLFVKIGLLFLFRSKFLYMYYLKKLIIYYEKVFS